MKFSQEITRDDCFHLSYGALLGYCFILFASSRVFLAALIGIPMGVGGMALAVLTLRSTGIDCFQPVQKEFVRSHVVGISLTCVLAFAFSLVLMAFLPQGEYKISLFFLALTAMYFASYLVYLTCFDCSEGKSDRLTNEDSCTKGEE